MPVFIERYMLPIFAAVTVLVAITNPMHWDWKLRLGGTVVVITSAYWASHLVHRRKDVGKTENSVGSARPEDPDRMILPPEVTVARMLEPFGRYTTVQATELSNKYLGTWFRFSGRVRDVAHIDEGRDMMFFVNEERPDAAAPVTAVFEANTCPTLRFLVPGQQVTILGEITSVSGLGIMLHKSEIVPQG
jgi:hypothetical protein